MTPALPPDKQQAPFSKEDAAGRLRFLDGLRGIAALAVFFWHFANTFYPLVNKDFKKAWIMQTPIWIAYNGAYAVMIFFVLSGFVLSLSTTNSKSTLPALLISRYFRLSVPILVSLIFAWLLLEGFSGVRVHLQQINPNPWIRVEFFGAHIPAFLITVKDAAYQVYSKGQNLFNNVLWTMQIELVGSIGIYLLYKLIPASYRWYGLAAFCLSFFVWHWYLGFPIGAAIQECWRRNKFHPNAWFWPLLILGLACSMASQVTIFSSSAAGFIFALGAGLVVLSIFHLPAASRILCAPFPQFLGRISFCFYLVHVPLLISIGAWLYFHLAGGNELRIALLLPIMLVISFCIAWVMTVTVDEPLLRKLRQFKRKRT
jgi:peptidoglycan/LPS O-acetylase OafA/YrhL